MLHSRLPRWPRCHRAADRQISGARFEPVRGWLLDTSVVSELRKSRPNSAVSEFVAAQPGEVLFTTEVTFGEIRFGIEQLEDAGRRTDIHMWLNRTLRPLFLGRVLAITEDVIVRWKTMAVEGQSAATPLGNQTCSLQLSPRWKTSSSSRAIPANLLPPGFRYSIRGRASCTCTAKRCELNRPHPCTRWQSLFSGVVDNRGSRMFALPFCGGLRCATRMMTWCSKWQ